MASLALNATADDRCTGGRGRVDHGVMGSFDTPSRHMRNNNEYVATGPQRPVVCLNFTRGRCVNGIKCSRSHTLASTNDRTSFAGFTTHNISPFPLYMQQGEKQRIDPPLYSTADSRPQGWPPLRHQPPFPLNQQQVPYRRSSPVRDRAADALIAFGDTLPLHHRPLPTDHIIDTQRPPIPHGRPPLSQSMPLNPQTMPHPRPPISPSYVRAVPPRFSGDNQYPGNRPFHEDPPPPQGQPPPALVAHIREYPPGPRDGSTLSDLLQEEEPMRPRSPLAPSTDEDTMRQASAALPSKPEWPPDLPPEISPPLPALAPAGEGTAVNHAPADAAEFLPQGAAQREKQQDSTLPPPSASSAAPCHTPRTERPWVIWKSGEVCRSFQKGICQYGNGCIHHHIRLSRPFEFWERSEICRNHLLWGKCTYGERCTYVHLTLSKYPHMIQEAPTWVSSSSPAVQNACTPQPQAEVLSPPSSHDDRGVTTSAAAEAQTKPPLSTHSPLTISNTGTQERKGDKSMDRLSMNSSPLVPATSPRDFTEEDDAPTPRLRVQILPENEKAPPVADPHNNNETRSGPSVIVGTITKDTKVESSKHQARRGEKKAKSPISCSDIPAGQMRSPPAVDPKPPADISTVNSPAAAPASKPGSPAPKAVVGKTTSASTNNAAASVGKATAPIPSQSSATVVRPTTQSLSAKSPAGTSGTIVAADKTVATTPSQSTLADIRPTSQTRKEIPPVAHAADEKPKAATGSLSVSAAVTRKGKTPQRKAETGSPSPLDTGSEAKEAVPAAATAGPVAPEPLRNSHSQDAKANQISKGSKARQPVATADQKMVTDTKSPASTISITEVKKLTDSKQAVFARVDETERPSIEGASAPSPAPKSESLKTLSGNQPATASVPSKAKDVPVKVSATSSKSRATSTVSKPSKSTSSSVIPISASDLKQVQSTAEAIAAKPREVCRNFLKGCCKLSPCPRDHVSCEAQLNESKAPVDLLPKSQVASGRSASRNVAVVDKTRDDESIAGSSSSRRRKSEKKSTVTAGAVNMPSDASNARARHTEQATSIATELSSDENAAPPLHSAPLMAPSLSRGTTSSNASSTCVSLPTSDEFSPRSANASLCVRDTRKVVLPPGVCRDWWLGRCQRQICRYAHSRTADLRQITDPKQQAHQRIETRDTESLGQASATQVVKSANLVSPRTPQKDTPLVPPGLGLEQEVIPLTTPPRRDLDDKITLTVLDGTKVTFGPGLKIHRVQTGFESTQIFIDDLPSSATPASITLALEPLGDVTAVNMVDGTKKGKSMGARITFSKAEEAEQAIKSLDGAEFMGTTIVARPDSFKSSVGKGTLRDGDVLITFPAPNRTGYAGYPTMKQAEKAIKKANGYEIRGLLIRAVHYEGLPTVGNYNVRFTGLPGDATSADLDVFGPNEGVMMKHPIYVSMKRAIDGLLSLLQKFDTSVSLNVLAPPYKHDVRAWAHFSKPNIADRFCEAVHTHRQGFIGNAALTAHHFRTLAWTLPGGIYDVLADEIRLLRSYLWDTELSTSISILDMRWGHGRAAPVKVKLVSTDIQTLTKPKAAFEKLLHGERVTQDGETAWDGFFATRPGAVFLEELERNHPGVLVNRDIRRRALSLFGSPGPRARVRDIILKKFDVLQKQRIHTFQLSGRLIGLFFRSDLVLLQDQLGRENVVLELQARVLKVRGGEDAQKAAQAAIARARARHSEEREPHDSECPVCLDDITDPFTLQCGHKYCKSCISDYLVAASDTKVFPLSCLGDEAKCSHHIPLDTAQQLLPPDAFDGLTRASFFAYVHSRPKEFFYCPTPGCEQVYRATPKGKMLQCPSCLVKICGHCHVAAHEGDECRDSETEDQTRFEEWKKGRDVKNCPNCKATIEREAGCNHMTCTRCKTHICWVCLDTFEKGEDVYPHMRTIHGGIGL